MALAGSYFRVRSVFPGYRMTQSRCDHGHPEFAFKRLVENGADDNVGIGTNFISDASGCLVDLKQGHVHAAARSKRARPWRPSWMLRR